MANAPVPETVKFGPFTNGVNNVDEATSLAASELLACVNFDIDRNGKLHRRLGTTRVIPLTASHSIWARDLDTAFCADGEDLLLVKRDANDNLSSSVLRSGGLQLYRPISYVDVNGDVYYSNGVVTGKILADDSHVDWGCPKPTSSPVLAAASPGLLPAGYYRVAFSYLNDSGEESGLTQSSFIQLTSAGAISVSGIPTAVPTGVDSIRVWVSKQNSETLYLYDTYPANTVSLEINLSSTLGQAAEDRRLEQMLAADMLAYYNGRIYGASGTMAWFTEALRYGLYDPRRNFLMFKRGVNIMLPVTDGIYFGTPDKVYFYAGKGPGEFVPRVVCNFGAVKGTGMEFPKKEEQDGVVVGWFSERGFVKAYDGGRVQMGDKERTMIGQYDQGAAMYRESRGIRQILATMRQKTRSGIVSNDSAEAEVRRANSNL